MAPLPGVLQRQRPDELQQARRRWRLPEKQRLKFRLPRALWPARQALRWLGAAAQQRPEQAEPRSSPVLQRQAPTEPKKQLLAGTQPGLASLVAGQPLQDQPAALRQSRGPPQRCVAPAAAEAQSCAELAWPPAEALPAPWALAWPASRQRLPQGRWAGPQAAACDDARARLLLPHSGSGSPSGRRRAWRRATSQSWV